ncbi:hypothetical protein Pint_06495 [Pistacia integerrima]|uniref:Uncharacterized protein n=1 Tax=Pistacia integerrima TaxID=434235 RepID=A0ACC0ZA01_9ROSI|nr:hypothetical protein Pint_06495 [Pistacia integerrima]
MNKTTPPPPLPPPPPPPPNPNQESTEPQLLRTLIKILTEDTTALESLTPHIQHFTQPVLLSLLSSKTLAKRPNTLLSFKWAQSHLPPSLRQSPLPLLSLLPSLFQHRKYLDAKSLLVSFINSDRQRVLRSYIVNPSNWDPKKYGIKLSKLLFDMCISAYVQSRKPHLEAKIFSKMKRLKVKPGLLTCNVLINGLWYLKEGKVEEPSNTMRKMEESGFPPDTVTYNTSIDGYCIGGKMAEAFRTMDEMGRKGLKMDSFTLNTILHTLWREKKLDEAYDLLNRASERGYYLDEMNYGTLINGYYKDKKEGRALKLWDEMKEKKIVPSIVTYNIIIAGPCHLEKTKQAIDKLNELLGSGLFPNETTYNTIMHGYCREGKVEKAFQFHNKMVENSFKPDVFTCNILLRGLCREGMLEKALKLFNTWISKGRTIDAVTYNTMISSLCKEGRWKDAFDLLSEMEEKKLRPDHYTFKIIHGALTDAGRLQEAEDFKSKMVEEGKLKDLPIQVVQGQSVVTTSTSEGFDSSSIVYSEQINELCSQGEYKDAIYVPVLHFVEKNQIYDMKQSVFVFCDPNWNNLIQV